MKINEYLFKNALKILFLLVILISFFLIMKPFIMPIIFGGIFCLALSPIVDVLKERFKFSQNKAIASLFLGIGLVFVLPSVIFLTRSSKMITAFFQKNNIKELNKVVLEKFNLLVQKLNITEYIEMDFVKAKLIEVLDTASGFILNLISNFLSSIPSFALDVIVMTIAFLVFMYQKEPIKRFFLKYSFFEKENSELISVRLSNASREVLVSNVLTGGIQSLIVSLGSLFCGIGDFYTVFVITFVLSFIPIIGAAPIAFVLAISAFIDGNIGIGIAMAVIGGFAGLVDNFLRPYFNSRGEVKVPSYIGFVSVLGGVMTFGLSGLFIGPLLASFMIGIVPVIIKELFNQDLNL